MKKYAKNAVAIKLPLRGGNHGLLGTVVPIPLYATMLNTPFVDPPNPGPTPNISGLNNNAERQVIKLHKYNRTQYNKNNKFKKKTHAMIINAFKDKCLQNLKQPLVRYSNYTIQELFFYLY